MRLNCGMDFVGNQVGRHLKWCDRRNKTRPITTGQDKLIIMQMVDSSSLPLSLPPFQMRFTSFWPKSSHFLWTFGAIDRCHKFRIGLASPERQTKTEQVGFYRFRLQHSPKWHRNANKAKHNANKIKNDEANGLVPVQPVSMTQTRLKNWLENDSLLYFENNLAHLALWISDDNSRFGNDFGVEHKIRLLQMER